MATNQVLLDTDILSEYLKGKDQNVVRHAQKYSKEFPKFTFSSVTVFEIVRGLEEKGAASQVSKAIVWLERNDQIVPTAEDYLTSAYLKARAKARGRVIELPDCLIASAASRLGLTLVTGNTKDFEVIIAAGSPLTLANWREI